MAGPLGAEEKTAALLRGGGRREAGFSPPRARSSRSHSPRPISFSRDGSGASRQGAPPEIRRR
eukprot:7798816-Pyramimonas_sp.AAC.1